MATQIEPFYRAFGDRVQRARQRKGLSQAELGERLGLTRASVANIENAKQRVLGHTLLDLVSILGLPLDELVPSQTQKVDEGAEELELELVKKLGISTAKARKLLSQAK